MVTYLYKAREETGKPIAGTLEGTSSDDIALKLRKMGYTPISIDEVTGESFLSGVDGYFQTIRTHDIVVFNFQLANMLSAGLTLLNCLKILEQQTENKKLKTIIGDIGRSVETGLSFSEALAKHPKNFSPLFVSMVKAGEVSGRLAGVLKRVSEYLESQEELREKIKTALFYPVILLCAGIAVIILIVSFVMPQFVDIFQKAQIPLPLPTRILYVVGVVLKKFWYLILGGIFLIYFAFKNFVSTEAGCLQFDRFTLKIPVIGPLIRKTVIARFCRTLGTLLESGVPILTALDILKDVVGNKVMMRVVVQLKKSVEQGEGLSTPLKVSEEFPVDSVQMIAAGEETGKLDEMLHKIADFYETSLSFSIKKLTTLLEPIFLAIMGLLVGFIMASMLLPIFDMLKPIRYR